MRWYRRALKIRVNDVPDTVLARNEGGPYRRIPPPPSGLLRAAPVTWRHGSGKLPCVWSFCWTGPASCSRWPVGQKVAEVPALDTEKPLPRVKE